MVTQTEFRHAAMKHFLLNISECRAGGITGMLRMYVQILSDFHGMNILSPEHEFSAGIKYTRTGIVLQEELPMADVHFTQLSNSSSSLSPLSISCICCAW